MRALKVPKLHNRPRRGGARSAAEHRHGDERAGQQAGGRFRRTGDGAGAAGPPRTARISFTATQPCSGHWEWNQSDWAQTHLPTRRGRNDFYTAVGYRIPAGEADRRGCEGRIRPARQMICSQNCEGRWYSTARPSSAEPTARTGGRVTGITRRVLSADSGSTSMRWISTPGQTTPGKQWARAPQRG